MTDITFITLNTHLLLTFTASNR